MRILPGRPKQFANETPTSHHLMQYAISEPAVLPQVATLFRSDDTAFSSILADRGLTSGNLYNGLDAASTGGYKVVGNTKIQWKVRGLKDRKNVMTRDAVCDAYPTEKGKYQSLVAIYLDSNWNSPYDVLELQDNRTLVHVIDDMLPEEVAGGEWKYYVRLVTKTTEDFIESSLLASGAEIGYVYNMFYEMSQTAYEKYTFDEMATTHLTIQRMKWSISGTAEAMKESTVWIEHNGQELWTTYQDMEMLRRWAASREYQLIFGKGTVTSNDVVVLKDLKNRDIRGGDGLLYQGDGALRFQYNGTLTKGVLQNVMKNLKLYGNSDGVQEVAVIAGQDFMLGFSDLMLTVIKANPVSLVDGSGSSKGINSTFVSYEYGGIRFVPVWHKWFDSPTRPQYVDPTTGIRKESGRAIFVSLGVDAGVPMVDLLALGKRAFLKGTVNGINKGGDDMSNSIDGKHVHILAETGIAIKDPDGVAELYIP